VLSQRNDIKATKASSREAGTSIAVRQICALFLKSCTKHCCCVRLGTCCFRNLIVIHDCRIVVINGYDALNACSNQGLPMTIVCCCWCVVVVLTGFIIAQRKLKRLLNIRNEHEKKNDEKNRKFETACVHPIGHEFARAVAAECNTVVDNFWCYTEKFDSSRQTGRRYPDASILDHRNDVGAGATTDDANFLLKGQEFARMSFEFKSSIVSTDYNVFDHGARTDAFDELRRDFAWTLPNHLPLDVQLYEMPVVMSDGVRWQLLRLSLKHDVTFYVGSEHHGKVYDFRNDGDIDAFFDLCVKAIKDRKVYEVDAINAAVSAVLAHGLRVEKILGASSCCVFVAEVTDLKRVQALNNNNNNNNNNGFVVKQGNRIIVKMCNPQDLNKGPRLEAEVKARQALGDGIVGEWGLYDVCGARAIVMPYDKCVVSLEQHVRQLVSSNRTATLSQIAAVVFANIGCKLRQLHQLQTQPQNNNNHHYHNDNNNDDDDDNNNNNNQQPSLASTLPTPPQQTAANATVTPSKSKRKRKSQSKTTTTATSSALSADVAATSPKRKLRKKKKSPQKAATTATAVVSGWTYGDLHPGNVLVKVNKDKVVNARLIDFECAVAAGTSLNGSGDNILFRRGFKPWAYEANADAVTSCVGDMQSLWLVVDWVCRQAEHTSSLSSRTQSHVALPTGIVRRHVRAMRKALMKKELSNRFVNAAWNDCGDDIAQLLDYLK
jgi:hypothetical protein